MFKFTRILENKSSWLIVLDNALFRWLIFHFNECFRVINVILKKVYEPLGLELYIHKLHTELNLKTVDSCAKGGPTKWPFTKRQTKNVCVRTCKKRALSFKCFSVLMDGHFVWFKEKLPFRLMNPGHVNIQTSIQTISRHVQCSQKPRLSHMHTVVPPPTAANIHNMYYIPHTYNTICKTEKQNYT